MRRIAAAVALLVAAGAAAEPGRWDVDYGASRIAFTAEQAQAPFDGAFASFEADVRFDPDALAQSRADVSIDTASVTTADAERDGILRGAGWFEVAQYPRAHFVATQFVKTPTGFEAHGELTVRTISVPVTFRFTLTDAEGRHELHGTAELDRLALGLGLGDWADTKWIGKDVRVTVTLIAR